MRRIIVTCVAISLPVATQALSQEIPWMMPKSYCTLAAIQSRTENTSIAGLMLDKTSSGAMTVETCLVEENARKAKIEDAWPRIKPEIRKACAKAIESKEVLAFRSYATLSQCLKGKGV
ncbi:hypothetical protein E0H46_28780 [Rhizobium leguminosarum bv. viciae]|nr:hypothetical protein E0H46_28780 [Rhizobium leguminosarum bv. viciae]